MGLFDEEYSRTLCVSVNRTLCYLLCLEVSERLSKNKSITYHTSHETLENSSKRLSFVSYIIAITCRVVDALSLFIE